MASPGDRFGKLVLLGEPFAIRVNGCRRLYAVFECDCGTIKAISLHNPVSGNQVTCGCSHGEANRKRCLRHGCNRRGQRGRLYQIWAGMLARCRNMNYDRYGGRGIAVCEEWQAFQDFKDWAESHGYESHLTIERDDYNGNYCPSNCRWIPKGEQTLSCSRNRVLEAFGETKIMLAWSNDPRCKVQYKTLHKRLKDGWDVEEAISTPLVFTKTK